MIGRQGADKIIGSKLANVLVGGAGNDKINGRGGDDIIQGGSGNEILTGGAGSDMFRADPDRGGEAPADPVEAASLDEAVDFGGVQERNRSTSIKIPIAQLRVPCTPRRQW